jgi:hypothetical protein
MKRWTGRALFLALVVFVPVASAEEPKDEKTRPQPEPRKTIRVLQDPKDISSFYRSGGRSGGEQATHTSGPYGLASHYRSTAERRTGYLGWRMSAYEPPCLYVGPDGPYRRR